MTTAATAGASSRPQSAPARDVAAGARKGAGKPATAKPITTFSLVNRKGRTREMRGAEMREWWRSFNQALPDNGGQGDYWRNEVIGLRASYPPRDTTTPPRACQRYGDRGRLYPSYYVRSHASALVQRGKRRRGFCCCLDCFNDLWHRDRINQLIFEGEIVRDGVAVDYEQPLNELAPDTDGSPSAAVMQELANRQTTVVEAKLEPDDEASLNRMIKSHLAGQNVVTIQPFS